MKNSYLYLILIGLFALVSVPAGAQVRSVYTSTRTGACRTIRSSSEYAGFYEGECRGPAGYRVRLIEADIRQTLNVMSPSGKKSELNFWGFYPSFSSIGDKIEWRLVKGQPTALIARYFVADPEGVKKDTAYLIVSKIARSGSCVVDVIDPGANQNERARVSADSASAKPCRTLPS